MLKFEGCCVLCGESDKLVLEKHHWIGRSNAKEIKFINIKETVLLCLNCHRKITNTVNRLPPKVRKENKEAYINSTMGAMLELYGKYLKEKGLKHGDRIESI